MTSSQKTRLKTNLSKTYIWSGGRNRLKSVFEIYLKNFTLNFLILDFKIGPDFRIFMLYKNSFPLTFKCNISELDFGKLLSTRFYDLGKFSKKRSKNHPKITPKLPKNYPKMPEIDFFVLKLLFCSLVPFERMARNFCLTLEHHLLW